MKNQIEISIDFNQVNSWETFHSIFNKTMGFPEYYGNNMNAWIDCMSYVDEPETGMTEINIKEGESLEIKVIGTESAFKNCPEIFTAFIECTAFVNQRFIDENSGTRLKIIAT